VPQIVAEDQGIQLPTPSSAVASKNQQDEVTLGDVLPEDRLRSIWERFLKGADGSWQGHKEAWVLMISWADELDKMKTIDEVTRLSNVFSEKFNYGVVQGRIENSRSLPRHQVQRDLANFICEHDGPGHLLIIYYAGHGSKGPPGTLNLTTMRLVKLFHLISGSFS
jgi:Caspase domain